MALVMRLGATQYYFYIPHEGSNMISKITKQFLPKAMVIWFLE